MRSFGVVEADSVANDATGVLQGLEAMAMSALPLQRPDQALHRAVLLRGVRRDELLAQSIAADQGRVAAAGEDETVVRAKQERRCDATQCSIARVISACSRAASAVLDFPLRDKCHPSSSRLWQSITRASTAQPSQPATRGTDPLPIARSAQLPLMALPALEA